MLALEVHVLEPDGQERVERFGFGPILVGRSPLCQLRLAQPWVSNTEGSLTFDPGSVNYLNIGTGDKTQLDGELVSFHANVAVAESSELRIGNLRLRCRLFNAADDDPTVLMKRPEPGASPGPGAQSPKTVVWPAGGLTGTVAAEPASPSTAQERDSAAPASTGRELRHRTITTPPLGARAPAPPTTPSQPTTGRGTPGTPPLEDLFAQYRSAWLALFRAVRLDLEGTPTKARIDRAKALQRQFRALTNEPEFRDYLLGAELPAIRPGIPELEAWLQAIGREVLPPGMKLESGFSLGRLMQLVEALAAGFTMINSDQERVRDRMFRLPRRESPLYDEREKAVLAYLLSPHATWETRSQELMEATQQLFNHQSAMLQAMGAGARELLTAISPERIAEEAEKAGPAPQEGGGLFGRILKDAPAPEVALWQTFVKRYRDLTSGNQYEQLFHGKRFRDKYNRAIGALERR